MILFNNGCRGTIPYTLKVQGSTPAGHKKLFFTVFFFGSFFLFFFLTHIFIFLTDLKYTSRLIASSLSAFISKNQKRP